MVATRSTSEETMAFYRLLTEFADLPPGSPGRLILDEDGIIDVPLFIQMQDQYFMDMRHDVVITDDAGAQITRNQPLQIVKRVSLTWLKCYLIYIENEGRCDLSPDELNGLDKADFNRFRCSYSKMPELVRSNVQNPNYQIPAASTPAARFQKSIKRETTQYPILKDIRYFDKFEM